MNQYINLASPPGLPMCIPCPANSVSAGGDATTCTCNANTGRVNESDVTLPCIGEYIVCSSIEVIVPRILNIPKYHLFKTLVFYMLQLAQDLQKHPPWLVVFLLTLISPGHLHLPAVLGATPMRSLGQMAAPLFPDKQALLDRYLDSRLRHSILWR